MVKFIKSFFFDQVLLYDSLSKVSDGMCEDDKKKYIDFDRFKEIFGISIATTDTLIINEKKGYILFVEFKDFKKVRDFKKWFNKSKKQQIYLKAYESFLSLLKFLEKNGFKHEEYFKLDKRFILVYDDKDPKQKIKNHIYGKVKRVEYIFNTVLVIRCEKFKKIVGDIKV